MRDRRTTERTPVGRQVKSPREAIKAGFLSFFLKQAKGSRLLRANGVEFIIWKVVFRVQELLFFPPSEVNEAYRVENRYSGRRLFL